MALHEVMNQRAHLVGLKIDLCEVDVSFESFKFLYDLFHASIRGEPTHRTIQRNRKTIGPHI